MKSNTTHLLVLLVLSVVFTLAFAIDGIHLKRGVVTRSMARSLHMGSNFNLFHTKYFVPATVHQQLHPFLIKLNSSVSLTEDFFSEFTMSSGVTLDHYLPHHAFLVHSTVEQINAVAQRKDVDFVTEFEPEYKISSELSSDDSLERALIKRIQTHEEKNPSEKPSEETLEEQHESELAKLTAHKERVLISINLVSKNSDAADKVTNEIQQALVQESIMFHIIKRVSSDQIAIAVPFEHAVEAATVAAHHFAVHWVQILDIKAHRDNKYTKWVVQTGQPDASIYTQAGITGKNQVIGYGDSGLDIYNCFFWDDNHPVPFTNATAPLPATNHRKIIGYNAFMDDLDDTVGHGTHVGGSLAGQSAHQDTPITAYNGMASSAKLAFLDIGCSKIGGCTCEGAISCPCSLMPNATCPAGSELFMPVNLNEGYFPFSYNLGARIHSNSIGGVIGEGYGIESSQIDQFMYEHSDFLVVWSAGNSGRNDGYMTLTGPFKQSKNALIIAASTSAHQAWVDMMQNFKNYDAGAQSYKQGLSTANFCQCNATCNQKTCSSIAVLNNEAGCCEYFKNCSIPIPELKSDPFANVNRMCCKQCALENLENPQYSQYYQMNNLATFSSLGPAIDGRIKPDVAAPGYFVLSAKAHESQPQYQCTADNSKDMTMQIQPMAGTSMATPTAASTATLVRDYFESGFYPTGSATEKDILHPSAALVKSVLINSAQPMNGYARIVASAQTKFSALQPAQRRFFEGHGLINLQSTLYLKEKTTNKLFVKDRASLSTGYIHNYDLKISKTGIIAVTVAWTDPPSLPTSSIALVNDLDLEVTVGETVLRGNSLDASTAHIADRLNNVEKLNVEVSANTLIRVSVRGYNIVKGPQDYAVVISGEGVNVADVKFSEAKEKPDKNMDGRISIRTGLFVLLVGGEGFIIAVLAIAVIGLLVARFRSVKYAELS